MKKLFVIIIAFCYTNLKAQTVSTFIEASETSGFSGLTIDGNYLYSVANFSGKVYKKDINTSDNNYEVFDIGHSGYEGICKAGNYIYVSKPWNGTSGIYRFNPDDTTINFEYFININHTMGLTSRNSELYFSADDKIYKVDLNASIPTPVVIASNINGNEAWSSTLGLKVYDNFLYVTEQTGIYKINLDSGNFEKETITSYTGQSLARGSDENTFYLTGGDDYTAVYELNIQTQTYDVLAQIEGYVGINDIAFGNNSLFVTTIEGDYNTVKRIELNSINTSIPDTVFEQALINQGIDSDQTINGQVLTTDIINVTDLNLQGLGINDLTGIEDFESLENLNCTSNPLTELDLSNNTQLEVLHVSVTNIETLNLENNTNLIELQCRVNHSLIAINLANMVNLEILDLADNWNLSSVDLSNCINLETLYYDNTFSSSSNLNLNNNLNLKYLYFSGFPFNTINLSNNTQLETLSCPNNALTSLDLNNNTSLLSLDCGDHNDDYGYFNNITDLDLSNNTNLEVLRCNNIGLVNLNISNCINLKELYSYTNPIDNLDVSNNSQLIKMNCSNNNITSIDLSNNANLEILKLDNEYGNWRYDLPYKNSFVDLNLDNNIHLTNVNIARNEFIETLHLQNGINQNHSLYTIECYSLHCIFVDDVSQIPSNWHIETTSNYVEIETECESLAIDNMGFSNDIIIYPNPTNKYFKIDSKIKIDELSLYSILGNKIKYFKAKNNEYNIGNIKSGIYFVLIKSNNKLIKNRLIIK